MIKQVDLAIVGAGPAGMEAAITAAKTGVTVAVVDEYSRPGGQYFKQASVPFHKKGLKSTERRHLRANKLFRQLEETDTYLLTNTTVWYIFPDTDAAGSSWWSLALCGPDAPPRLWAKVLILATGAYDRPIAFPGWTLPGVVTAGAVQSLFKTQGALPGRRFLFSGTGPLQLEVAAQLVQAGAEVIGILEGARVGFKAFPYIFSMWGQWSRLREGWEYLSVLRKAHVPIRLGWVAVEARGEEEVREVVIAKIDKNWRPIPGTYQIVSADTLVIGYGFVPSTELSRMLGCKHDYIPEQGGFVPQRDDEMQTSVPGVYAVGDGSGIGGAEMSLLEGRIAGLAAARRLGKLSGEEAQKAIDSQRPALARERRFAHMLGKLFTPGPGLYQLATDETIICRCEEVTRKEIVEAIATGSDTVTWVKRMTRAGMGPCQGRMCGNLVAELISQQTKRDLAQILPDTVRPPVRPVPMECLLGGNK